MEDLKQAVHDFWNEKACGELYAQGESEAELLRTQAAQRYALEPFIADFARFPDGAGKRVLEVGVGMGADHLEWARRSPAELAGIDLTPRAIEFTRNRLALHGLTSQLSVADAEALPFADDRFDIVYSWGVLHHSPETAKAISEVHRVLKPGGVARVMVYHSPSVVGLMLWMRYALLRGQPWKPLRSIYAERLESPGTKGYSVAAARALFQDFRQVNTRVELSPGDLLQGGVGQRHRGALLTVATRLWPRWLLRFVPGLGLYLLIEAVK